VPDGFYWDSVEVFSTCYTVDSSGSLVATGLVAIAPGTSSNLCNFGADFATGGIQYQLRMGPEKPGTGWATVSCNTLPPATACNSWTITPNTNAVNGNFPTVATLYKATKNGPVAIPLEKRSDNEFAVPAGAKLTDAQYKALKAGNLYVNVHSEAHKDGEIRAQLKP